MGWRTSHVKLYQEPWYAILTANPICSVPGYVDQEYGPPKQNCLRTHVRKAWSSCYFNVGTDTVFKIDFVTSQSTV